MRLKRTKLTVLAACLVLVTSLVVVSAPATTAQPVTIRFGSFTVGGAWYIWASAIASIIRPNLPSGSSLDVLPYQGGVGNPLLLAKGKAEIALSFLPCTKWAYDGIAPYKQPEKSLRSLVGGLSKPHRIGVLIRKASGIKSLEDVVKRKLPARIVSAQRGATGQAVAMQVLSEYGITREKLEKWGGKLEHLRMPVAMTRIKDGHADIIIHNVGFKEPQFSELCLTTDIIFDEIPKDTRKKMAKKYGYVDGLFIEKNEFRGVKQGVPAIGYPTGLICAASLSDEVAYIITKSVCENPKALSKAHAALTAFDPKKAGEPERNGIPLHPGAAKYYKEKGLPH